MCNGNRIFLSFSKMTLFLIVTCHQDRIVYSCTQLDGTDYDTCNEWKCYSLVIWDCHINKDCKFNNKQKQRHLGKTKKDSISIAHKFSMKSIIVSGCSFFAATFGVALYSRVDMIGAICTLLARGAVISTVVVLLVLPAMFMVFDPIIVHTSKGFLPDKK